MLGKGDAVLFICTSKDFSADDENGLKLLEILENLPDSFTTDEEHNHCTADNFVQHHHQAHQVTHRLGVSSNQH